MSDENDTRTSEAVHVCSVPPATLGVVIGSVWECPNCHERWQLCAVNLTPGSAWVKQGLRSNEAPVTTKDELTLKLDAGWVLRFYASRTGGPGVGLGSDDTAEGAYSQAPLTWEQVHTIRRWLSAVTGVPALDKVPVVWADEASPFTGDQVRTLLNENERLRGQNERLRAELEQAKRERLTCDQRIASQRKAGAAVHARLTAHEIALRQIRTLGGAAETLATSALAASFWDEAKPGDARTDYPKAGGK